MEILIPVKRVVTVEDQFEIVSTELTDQYFDIDLKKASTFDTLIVRGPEL